MSAIATYWLLSFVTLAVCALAIWKGGVAERFGAIVILSIVILQRLGFMLAPRDLASAIMLGGDALTALGLLWLTVRYGSFWLGGSMLCYASTFVLHSVYLVTEQAESGLIYVWVNDLCFAGIHICLVVGTLVSWRYRSLASQPAMVAG